MFEQEKQDCLEVASHLFELRARSLQVTVGQMSHYINSRLAGVRTTLERLSKVDEINDYMQKLSDQRDRLLKNASSSINRSTDNSGSHSHDTGYKKPGPLR